MLVKSKSGFECEVKTRAGRDWRLVRLISEVEEGGPGAITSMVRLVDRLLGSEQAESLMEYMESLSEDGIVEYREMYEEITSIMNALNANEGIDPGNTDSSAT